MKYNLFAFVSLVVLFAITADITSGASWDDLKAQYRRLLDSSNYQDSLLVADQMIQLEPRNSYGYVAKGNALKSLYRLSEAVDNYKQSVELNNKERFIGYRQIGSVYVMLGDFDSAVKYFNKAINDNNSVYSYTMFDIADAYLLKGDMTNATKAYNNAKMRIDESEQFLGQLNASNKGKIYLRAAWIAYQLDRNADSLEYAKTYKELKMIDNANLSLATYFARLGDSGTAKILANSFNDDNCDLMSLALYYLLIDDHINARRYFEKDYLSQRTPSQLNIWRSILKQSAMYPHDDWSKARNLEWFKNKVQ